MMWPNTFVLGGLVLDRDDVDSSFRIVEDAVGWDDASAVRSGMVAKSQQDGAWDSTGFLGARAITIDGTVSEATPTAAAAFHDQLVALSPQSVYVLQVSNDVLGVRTAAVRVTVGAVVTWVNRQTFSYTIQVTAPDPLKYGPQVFGSVGLRTTSTTGLAYPLVYPRDYGVPAGQTPGSISVMNTGTAAYWPRLRLDGPVPNPQVTLNETGDWVRLNGTLASGQWLDVDLANRRVLLNGQVSVRRLVTSSGNWLAVPAGGGSVSWAADGADPAAQLSVWSYEGAWL